MNSQSIECECGCWNIVLKVIPPGETCPCGNPQPHDVCHPRPSADDRSRDTSCKDKGKGYNIFQFERCKDCGKLHLGTGVCPVVGAKPSRRFACVAHSAGRSPTPMQSPCVPMEGQCPKPGACAPAGSGAFNCYAPPLPNPLCASACSGPPSPCPPSPCPPSPCPPSPCASDYPSCATCPGPHHLRGYPCSYRSASPAPTCGRSPSPEPWECLPKTPVYGRRLSPTVIKVGSSHCQCASPSCWDPPCDGGSPPPRHGRFCGSARGPSPASRGSCECGGGGAAYRAVRACFAPRPPLRATYCSLNH